MKKVLFAAMAMLMILCVCAAAIAESADPENNIIIVNDSNGDGVEGVMLSVCVKNYCTCVYTDENGQAILTEDGEEVEIHIVSVPEGYSFDAEAVYTLEDTAEPIVITKE